MTHTPGPWQVFAGTMVTNEKDELVAVVPESRIARDKFWEARDNIRLMAAAPNLLEACERAEQALRNLANGFLKGDAKTISENEAANLRAAIAKARGK